MQFDVWLLFVRRWCMHLLTFFSLVFFRGQTSGTIHRTALRVIIPCNWCGISASISRVDFDVHPNLLQFSSVISSGSGVKRARKKKRDADESQMKSYMAAIGEAHKEIFV